LRRGEPGLTREKSKKEVKGIGEKRKKSLQQGGGNIAIYMATSLAKCERALEK